MIQDPSITEQIQEQGLEVLKSIREGSPEAFQTVLSEVSRYNLFIGGVQTFFGVVCGICLFLLTRWAIVTKKEWRLDYLDNEDGPNFIFAIIVGIFLFIITPIALVHGIDNMSVGISPLGWLVTNMAK